MAEKVSVAVLMGGRSSERAISLVSGAGVCAALDRSAYEVRAIDVGYINGRRPAAASSPMPVALPDMLPLLALFEMPRDDVAFIALHGRGGEDGSIQGLLELLGMPYVGSGILASALALDKVRSKMLFAQCGIPTPRFIAWDSVAGEAMRGWRERVLEELGLPVVIKPACEGSSIGVSIVRAPEELAAAAELALRYDRLIFAEGYVGGTEITAAILGNSSLEVLPLVEIVPEGGFYDYERKYTAGATQEIVPARVPEKVAARAREAALAAHRTLGCRGWSRVDMIVGAEGVMVLEVNTIPGLTPLSLVPCAAAAVGISFPQLLDRLVRLALEPAGQGG